MSTPAFSTPPDRYAEDLLRLTRRDLDIGMTWWVDAEHCKAAHAWVIETLKAEGYAVLRETDLVTVSPKPQNP